MLTNKALWTIERNLDRSLTLGELADACGVSPFHLAHAFGEATGFSVMQYVRGRRLTEAAQSLASGDAPDILNLALDAGYGSHEAFSRAFRAQFGTTPETVRKNQTVEDLAMIQPMKVPEKTGFALAPPRFVSSPPMLVVGIAERHSFGATEGIPGQWQRFMRHYADIPDKVQPIPLGVSANMDDDGNFEYITAVEVSNASHLPKGFKQLRIPARHYAVFRHSGHVSTLGQTYSAIWNDWLPAHSHKAAEAWSGISRHLTRELVSAASKSGSRCKTAAPSGPSTPTARRDGRYR
jgi:AraC family transcriptional regulator